MRLMTYLPLTIASAAILLLPLPAWSQFKEPEKTGLVGGGGTGFDWSATLTSDLLEVYWISLRGNGDWDIWSARRESVDGPWEDLQPLDIVNTNLVEMAPHLSPDGLTLTFSSLRREGGYGGVDLWQSMRVSPQDPWQEPVNMGPTINTRGNEGGATFSPDGLELIYDRGCLSPRYGSCNPATLRRSTRLSLSDPWSEPESMSKRASEHQFGGAVNPSLSHDGLSLYFTASGDSGAHDIFVSERASLDAPFGPRENLGEPVNTPREERHASIAPDGSLYYTRNWTRGQPPAYIWRSEAETPVSLELLNAGDADQDFDFDQRDLVQVQVAAKYLTGQAATWGDGDWNGAPGGSQGSPPAGDGLFNQLDIIAAQQAATYLTGPYAAIQSDGRSGDGQTSVVYSPDTGELAVDAPLGVELTSINIDSAASIFTGDAANNLGGSFDNDSDGNIFKATFGSSFGSISFGNVAQAGLSEEVVLGDLSVVGSLAGGGELGEVDLIYVPEPTSALLLCVGLVIGLIHFRRATS